MGDLTRAELEAMLADLEADHADIVASLVWVNEQLATLPPVPAPSGKRSYKPISWPDVRRVLQQWGEIGYDDLAEELKVSRGQLRMKLPLWWDEGRLIKVKRQGRIYWAVAKPSANAPKLKPKERPSNLRVLPGGAAVPGTARHKGVGRKVARSKARRGYR